MFKQIRKAAKRMRPEVAEQQITQIVKGARLREMGISEVEGNPIDDKKFYSGTGLVKVPVNHYRKMKKAYTKGGVDATVAYMDESYDRTHPQETPQIPTNENSVNISWPGM